MQHSIRVETLGPQGPAMAHAIESCVHCGFCLPACPTYRELGEEMDSPRGRIFLMKSALEGGLTVEETLPYVDRCLACLGCVTACPSGVAYGELISAFRAHAEPLRARPVMARVRRMLVQQTLPYPGRFRVAATLGRATRPLHGLVPGGLRPMLGLLPESLPAAQPLPAVYPAEGTRRARVALLAGCVQQALDPGINWATLRVLAANGVETVIPAGQGCCGALDMHLGGTARGQAFARRNIAVFPRDVDAIITNAAGCGSGVHEYMQLFEGEPDDESAAAFAHAAKDITVFLAELGIVTATAAAAAAQGGLSRRLPSGPRAGRHPAAAQPAAQHPEPDAVGDPRGRAVLRLGGHLQHGAAGDRRAAGPAQSGEHPAHRRGRGRDGQHRLPGADPDPPPGRRPAAADLPYRAAS